LFALEQEHMAPLYKGRFDQPVSLSCFFGRPPTDLVLRY
jgi:hypothetical protein